MDVKRRDRDQALDGLRGIAALLVVFFHCGVELRFPPIVLPGFSGVHLFFVLSGYLISRPFLGRLLTGDVLPSWRNYGLRRFMRIYPAYFAALVVFVGMRVAGGLRTPSLRDIVLHLCLVFNWGTPAEFLSINIAMWTLAIEAQFYVILPLAALLAKRFSRGPSRRAAFSIGLAFTLGGWLSRSIEYFRSSPGELRFRLPFSFLDLFAMGIFVAYFELTQAAFLRSRGVLRGVLALTALVMLLGSNAWLIAQGGGDWLSPPTMALAAAYPTLVCGGFALILLLVVTRAHDGVFLLTAAPLVFIGQISYSMYLFHVGVGYFLLTRLPPALGHWLGAHPPIYALVQLGPVVAVSYVVYRAIELPPLRWVERFTMRGRERKQLTPS